MRFPKLIAIGFVLCWNAPAAPCFEPTGDWITAADLAAAAPALAGLPAGLRFGYAPAPGLTRVIHPDELRRLAEANGLADPALRANICFAWPVAPLTKEAVRAAIERELTPRAAGIEIVEWNRADAPAGKIFFPLTGLSGFSAAPTIWKGYVVYAGTRRFSTWASVRLSIHETHWRTTSALHAGERFNAAQCLAEPYDGPLQRTLFVTDPAQLEGQVATRDLAPGSLLADGLFSAPPAVVNGAVVTVFSEDGGAHIKTQGIALAAGRAGEVIAVRNPLSNRTYKARISAPGQVQVIPGSSLGLAISGAKVQTSL